jgi:hypothetical protein
MAKRKVRAGDIVQWANPEQKPPYKEYILSKELFDFPDGTRVMVYPVGGGDSFVVPISQLKYTGKTIHEPCPPAKLRYLKRLGVYNDRSE